MKGGTHEEREPAKKQKRVGRFTSSEVSALPREPGTEREKLKINYHSTIENEGRRAERGGPNVIETRCPLSPLDFKGGIGPASKDRFLGEGNNRGAKPEQVRRMALN